MIDRSLSLSRSVEDYLKAIYSLAQEGATTSTSNIAESLDVQPASVSGMIKRLKESGYVHHLPYRGVRLSEEGTREALRIIRRHRILETYLNKCLKYTWDDVHGEADRLEHAASEELIERMASALGDPSHDPHGAPIPTRAGEVEQTDHITLAEVAAGDTVLIRAVRGDDPERLRYLAARGLLPGVHLHVDSRAPFNGPITLRIGDGTHAAQTVGFDLATRIQVAVEEG
jgi:DtxR family Mn-dependent transcriptional regulator